MLRKIVIALTIALFIYIISPFIASIGMAAIFSILFYPLMERVEFKRFPNSLAAALLTFAVTLVLFLPTSLLIVAGAKAGLNELKHIRQTTEAPSDSSDQAVDRLLNSSGIERLLHEAALFVPIDPDEIIIQLKDYIQSLAAKLGEVLSSFISRVPSMAIAFAVFLFSLYYFMADGAKIIVSIKRNSFFSPSETLRLMKTFSGLCRSVILASVVSGAAQAFLAALVCFIVGIKQFHIVFFAVLVASFIPLIGAFPVVMSIAVFQLFNGHITQGVIIATSSLFISTMDNFIRPFVIRGGSDLHPLLGFVSALGGLVAFGVPGIFLGPVIGGVAAEMARLARD